MNIVDRITHLIERAHTRHVTVFLTCLALYAAVCILGF